MENQYLIGQRVILSGKVIGTVIKPENNHYVNGIWVMNPEKGFASCYDYSNVAPLPGGQL